MYFEQWVDSTRWKETERNKDPITFKYRSELQQKDVHIRINLEYADNIHSHNRLSDCDRY